MLTEIKLQKLSDNLKIYYAGRFNLAVVLNVTNAYTISDTLYVNGYNLQAPLKFVGPFVNGRLFSAGGVTTSSEMLYPINNEILNYKIRNSGVIMSKEYTVPNSKLCGDTVYVNLDIR